MRVFVVAYLMCGLFIGGAVAQEAHQQGVAPDKVFGATVFTVVAWPVVAGVFVASKFDNGGR